MNSLYASDITKQVIWPQFVAHFKSETTKASYLADISEIMNLFHQDFLDIGKKEIKEYYDFLQNKVKQGILQPGTMAKKFKELHSFAEYICKNKAGFPVGEEYVDEYYPYLKLVEKQKQFVKSVPVEHVDRMLKAAEEGARQGMENTKEYLAKFGRAKSLMERAIGFQDAGATSVWLIFQGMREFVEGTI